GLEEDFPGAVVRHSQRVVLERLAVQAVASAEILVGPDQGGGAPHHEARARPVLEVEPHRPPLEVLAADDALLVEQAGAEREPCLLVAARDPYLVAHL